MNKNYIIQIQLKTEGYEKILYTLVRNAASQPIAERAALYNECHAPDSATFDENGALDDLGGLFEYSIKATKQLTNVVVISALANNIETITLG